MKDVNYYDQLYIKFLEQYQLYLLISVREILKKKISHLICFLFLVPFIFLGILNILIVSRLHARQRTSIQRSTISTSSTSGTEPQFVTTSTRKRQQRQRNTDRNITFMLITVAIAFMVMSFPFQ